MSVAFDTLRFVEKLEDGGFSHAQAKAAAEAFADATGEQLATKADLREGLAALKADFRSEIATVKADFRAEIATLKADVLLLKWMMGFVLAFQVGIFAKLFTH
jgi:hypothetical protein